jgi:hypothetical protein
MAQQNSIKFACQLIFKQNLYVYIINTIIFNIYIYIFRAFNFSKFKMAIKIDNIETLYNQYIDNTLRLLPFWNLVSIF